MENLAKRQIELRYAIAQEFDTPCSGFDEPHREIG